MKIDPYKHKERWEKWKEAVRNGIPEISQANSDILLKYLQDMEYGINISSMNTKGSRSFIRLNTLREKMLFFAKRFKIVYGLDNLTEVNEDQLCLFFSRVRNGEIKRQDGKEYASISDFVKVFKAFWHWHQKVSKKKGIEIKDITLDLDARQEKPDWVYLTEDQVKRLCSKAKSEYKVLIMFLYDTGIRSPTELINVRVSDLYNDCKELHIREEISKTFGRKIKLMLCSSLLNDYIKEKNLKPNDQLFNIKPYSVNKYLKTLAVRIFGDSKSLAGKKYSELTMYDFRHCSCCYWLPRYKSESALKYRFGWKGSDKIHYYSELLGMKDTIAQEDLLIDTTKTDIEKELEGTKKENILMQERMRSMEEQMKKILEVVNGMVEKVKN
ncbi:MAG: site-specific integrase [Nanoarchaeota archaeon]